MFINGCQAEKTKTRFDCKREHTGHLKSKEMSQWANIEPAGHKVRNRRLC